MIVYRCGHCGTPVNEDGSQLDKFEFELACNTLDLKIPTTEEKLVHGDCCPPEEDRMVQVTRDMAIDAGDRGLEGQWIKW